MVETTDEHQPDQPVEDDGEEPQTLVGISFPDIYRAQEFLTAATGLAAKGRLKLKDAVIVVEDDEGHTHVKETVDPEPGRTAFSGALWAGLIGLVLGGPVGWAAGLAVGAGAGAVTAKLVDLGISDEWVAWFREAVQPGTATIALLAEDLDREALVAEARRFTGAELVYANLDDQTLERIREALTARGLVQDHGRPGASISGSADVTGPKRAPSRAAQADRASAISSRVRATKFHHMKISDSNGVPPSSMIRVSCSTARGSSS